ncbi:Dehydrogenase orsE [Exophiala dermatitidis]
MALTNEAAWLHKPNEKLQVFSAEIGKPGPGEALIKNHAVAINPVNWKIQDGVFPSSVFPRIMGNDLAGEIVEVGEDVSGFSKGQRVLAHAVGIAIPKPQYGSFQKYTVVPVVGVCPLPDKISYEEAAVLPLALSTATDGLFHEDKLGLPKPSHEVQKSDKALLVWGGSSSVGSAVIQVAVAAGLTVIATASKKNFEFCKELGATEVFDYNSPSIVGDLTAALQNHNLAGAYDAIGCRDTQLNTAQVLAQLGGGNMAVVLPPSDEIPATVNAKGVFATEILLQFKELGNALYHDFLPEALQSGQIKPAPKPTIVGHGLEFIQAGLDRSRQGVSAVKLVVAL